MKREIRDRWTAGLRSGEYAQGGGRFEDGGRFCCLGVLCDVMGQPTRLDDRDNEAFVLPLLGATNAWHLAALNDGPSHVSRLYPLRSTFLAIADWIDENIAVEP